MSAQDRNAVRMAAMAVGYKAKLGEVDPMDVDDMVTRARQLLKGEDFLSRACTTFARQYELHWRDPDELEALGNDLLYAVELDARPDVASGEVADG